MVEMIHKLTGVKMQVPDDRVEYFLAQGHKRAPAVPKKKPVSKKNVKK